MMTHHPFHRVMAPVAGLLLIGCGGPGAPEPGLRSQAIATPSTITFDELNLAPGRVLTTEYGPLGVVFRPDALSREQIGDAAGFGVWATPSGANYLALDTFGAQPPGAILGVQFVERGTGAPTTADAVGLFVADGDALPLPRARVEALDARGVTVEAVDTAAALEQVVFLASGIAGLRIVDLGGDGILIDDLLFTLGDDLDGDGIPNSIDPCPGTPAGPPVDPAGCSCDQRLAIACPPEDPWRNHGAYVSCVAHAASACLDEGLVGERGKSERVSAAAHSSIGKSKKK